MKTAFKYKPGSGVIFAFLILALIFASLVGVVYIVISDGAGKAPRAAATSVLVRPGDNIQAIVDANPTGTIFNLSSGTYSNQKVAPKDGQNFIGQSGAVLDGGHATDYAFNGSASNVTIKGLIIQDYASPVQRGAIQVYGSNWTIDGNEIRRNKGGAIDGADKSRILNNNVHHNGQIGIKVENGSSALVEGNEIYSNNCAWPSNVTSATCPWPGWDPYWEAGGTKFVRTTGLIVRANYVHDNVGPGLWTDIDNRDTLYENNRSINNSQHGIFHEISYNAIIRNNEVRCNGWERAPGSGWGWGGNILISTSQGTVANGIDVYGNNVEGCGTKQGGITLIQQDRNPGEAVKTYKTRNVYIHNNNIGQKNTDGLNGGFADFDSAGFTSGGNKFDFNHYYFASTGCACFEWLGGSTDFTGYKTKGQDTNGTIATGSLPLAATPTPQPVSTFNTCDFNKDGVVNSTDLQILVANWNKLGTGLVWDVTHDNRVGLADYNAVYFKTPKYCF